MNFGSPFGFPPALRRQVLEGRGLVGRTHTGRRFTHCSGPTGWCQQRPRLGKPFSMQDGTKTDLVQDRTSRAPWLHPCVHSVRVQGVQLATCLIPRISTARDTCTFLQNFMRPRALAELPRGGQPGFSRGEGTFQSY